MNTANRIWSGTKVFGWTVLLLVLLAGCSTFSEEEPALLVDGKNAEVAAQGSPTVSGKLSLSIRSYLPISKVEYYLGPTNGRPWKVATEQPFAAELDTATLEDGEHTISALIYVGRNVVEPAPLLIVVDNSDDDSSTPPDDGAGTNPPPSDPEPSPPSDTPQGDTLSRMLALVNEARSTGYDCDSKGSFGPTSPLELDSRLSAAAQVQADYLATRSVEGLTHTGPGGSAVSDRVSAEGYVWSTVGENIAAGQPTPEVVTQGWLESDGHCSNIMNPSYQEIGLAVAGDNSLRWVQVFAAPR